MAGPLPECPGSGYQPGEVVVVTAVTLWPQHENPVSKRVTRRLHRHNPDSGRAEGRGAVSGRGAAPTRTPRPGSRSSTTCRYVPPCAVWRATVGGATRGLLSGRLLAAPAPAPRARPPATARTRSGGGH